MTTPILKITEAANGQVDQYLTYNEALRALESSTNNFYVVDMSTGDVTMTDAANADPALNYIFSRNQVFRTSGNTVARVLTVPQSKRLFVVQNGGTFALTVKRGTSEISLAATLAAIFYCDGTANGLVAIVSTGNYVAGPASSADNEIALFDGASGKSLKRGPVVGTAALSNLVTSNADTTPGGVPTVGWMGIGAVGNVFLNSPNDVPVNGLWRGGDVTALGSYPSFLHMGDGAPHNTQIGGPSLVANQLVFRKKVAGVWQTTYSFWHTGNTSADVQAMLSAANNAAIRSAISASSLPPYTLGTVPSAAANTNLLIVITDLTGGREPCYSDGANWLRCSDKTIAS